MKLWKYNFIAELGNYINNHNCRILDNIYYFLCAIVYEEY